MTADFKAKKLTEVAIPDTENNEQQQKIEYKVYDERWFPLSLQNKWPIYLTGLAEHSSLNPTPVGGGRFPPPLPKNGNNS